jgi:hypothetical protein
MLITVQAAAKPADKEKGSTAPVDSVKTDEVGSYKVMVKNEGKCTLTVHFGKKTAVLEVFSQNSPCGGSDNQLLHRRGARGSRQP